jgi:hypothetical protein
MITDILKLKYLHHSFWFEFWDGIGKFTLMMMRLHLNEKSKIAEELEE